MPISNNRCAVCPAKEIGPCVDVRIPNPRLVFIGEAPGDRDRGFPFTGYAGKEFNFNLLKRLGLDREDVYVTNVCKCAEAREKTGQHRIPDATINACSQHWLGEELREYRQQLVVLMGAPALKTWRTPYGEEFDIELHHGYAWDAVYTDVEGNVRDRTVRKVFVVIHPAHGLHSPPVLRFIYEDFHNLREYIRGSVNYRTPPVNKYEGNEEYFEAHTEREVEAYLERGDDAAVDTETKEDPEDYRNLKTPYLIQVSVEPGTGMAIDATNRSLVKAVSRGLRKKYRTYAHNWMFDEDVCRIAGLFIENVVDTMEMAFTLQLERQSLKFLGFRLCGMRMIEYSDVVRPYAEADAHEYFLRALAFKEPKPLTVTARKKMSPEAIAEWEAHFARCFKRPPKITKFDGTESQPHSVGTKIGSALTWYEKGSRNLREKFREWDKSEQQQIIERVGLMPPRDLSRVPRHKAIAYACGDTDATLRIAPILNRMGIALAKSAGADRNDLAIPGSDYGWFYKGKR